MGFGLAGIAKGRELERDGHKISCQRCQAPLGKRLVRVGERNHGLRVLSRVSTEPPGRTWELCRRTLGGRREVSPGAGPELTTFVSVAISVQAV